MCVDGVSDSLRRGKMIRGMYSLFFWGPLIFYSASHTPFFLLNGVLILSRLYVNSREDPNSPLPTVLRVPQATVTSLEEGMAKHDTQSLSVPIMCIISVINIRQK